MQKKVLVVMGSDSDFPVLETCFRTLTDFGIPFEARICSAHRTPDQAADLARNAAARGFAVIIAAAGLAAHLPGVLAAQTILPVIGIPVRSGALAGQDALYAIVQMPAGVPVAAMAIDGAANAAVFAAQILALQDETITASLIRYKAKLADSVGERQKRLEEKLHAL
ncbi:MAG TPA: 5-(carboxyamino)imidazole ribonucleotide mutase [Clostridiales bacterium]|nr:5-(carboxyamino)imidazole ribonucleotide mutase [Clostridiales bacterium]